jgi:hypothetical protein
MRDFRDDGHPGYLAWWVIGCAVFWVGVILVLVK